MNTGFHFISTEWFAADSMAYFKTLDKLESASIMLDFVDAHKSAELEKIAIYLMPYEFSLYYLHKRLSTHTKEAFRRAFLFTTGHGVSGNVVNKVHSNGQLTETELTLIEFVRANGSFEISQLPTVLGHQPSEAELEEVDYFLSHMTDKNWQRLLRDSTKRRS